MTTEIQYVAKTTFKYNGVEYNRGDVVEPANGKWDHLIFAESSRFVNIVPVEKKPAPRRRSQKSGGTKNAS